ncbi:MAG TPA: nucleoside transporter C-terminal domain-containing protein [Bacteroidales bacterium]|jgi:CNT family concentrative nucleoside transporter|nr:NupC/NupG family nucleoside CNT transporter [Bacteroidales bacterium]HNY52120.1 nucleoside transporter C-terminal domain-containing protein [Bacteroidales bacterium]HOG55731.1 nucleoside transporter C-terminal domain-containing protein [Bacteroidales bacterium]HPB12312.1 nucleoside transporter C-terminal domain-containing protein [Bacteroidales bacterium]HPX42726.1 nucleoside transporter C-terminal domain-containing protein [Bacteroidales bacterium]
MSRFTGIIGIIILLGLAFLWSNNRKAINIRLVVSGLLLQLGLAIFILKVPVGQDIFAWLGKVINKLLDFSQEGALFVFGDLMKVSEILPPTITSAGVFLFTLIPTIIFVCVLVAMAYHVGLMQRVVAVLARFMHWVMRVSGSEALSNVASAFVGQVEAQIMIRPYLVGMTMSELLASMTGSMACIAGGVMAVYISMGVPASYLLAASLMAAPGALVISKIVFPETQESETKGVVKLEVKKEQTNIMDAISHGASDGMAISINVIAMLIGVIALVALVDALLGYFGLFLGWTGLSLDFVGLDVNNLRLKDVFGAFFSLFAIVMGVPVAESFEVGSLMGTKMVINEFVAYSDLAPMIHAGALSPKSIIIASFALCGFANFSSIAIQLGGIGAMIPSRKADLARLGFKAMICGTMASYISASLAGILM